MTTYYIVAILKQESLWNSEEYISLDLWRPSYFNMYPSWVILFSVKFEVSDQDYDAADEEAWNYFDEWLSILKREADFLYRNGHGRSIRYGRLK